jgi:hypothetical protein
MGLAVVLALLLAAAPSANADLKAHSRHSLYRGLHSKQLALPLPTASRPTLRRLPNGKLRVSFKVHYRAANWLHKGKAAPDRVMVTLEVARDLHSTGPDPVAPLFRKVIVHTLWAQQVTRRYTFDLPAKVVKKLASRRLFSGSRKLRAQAAKHVWIDIEQDRDYQSVDGSYDWREGSAATATIGARPAAASSGSASARASDRPTAHASAKGSIAEEECRGDTSHPCGYLTVRNQTANGIYCPSGAASATTNGEKCGGYGSRSGSRAGPATVNGTMNQMGVNVGVSGSAVECLVEGSEGNQPSNPVGFSNVDAEGNPQPYTPGTVSVSPGGSPEVASTGWR